MGPIEMIVFSLLSHFNKRNLFDGSLAWKPSVKILYGRKKLFETRMMLAIKWDVGEFI